MDTIIIDRRKSGADRSVGNRQRVMMRTKEALRAAAKAAVSRRKIKDKGAEEVTVKTGLLDEPMFHRTFDGGTRYLVRGGNKHYVVGDRIPKDDPAGAAGGAGTGDGGDDEFQFLLTEDEYLELVFEGLELPHLVKKETTDAKAVVVERDGLTTAGMPSALDVLRSLKRAKGRRMGLNRPKPEYLAQLEQKYEEEPTEELKAEIDIIRRRMKSIPWLDPVDLQYRRYDEKPVPITKAVVFCMLDVSGSMTEEYKDYAKRFFLLMHLFIDRQYEHVEIVFIRHTDEAEEVDEETFFYDTKNGGTVVSSGLKKIVEIQRARFPRNEYNIYVASASDGDNYINDNDECIRIIESQLLPMVQFMIYVEVGRKDETGAYTFFGIRSEKSGLWELYEKLSESYKNLLAKRITCIEDVYPVFREIFGKRADEK